MDLKRFIQLNEGRSMQMSLREKDGQVVESTNVVACNSYSFIGKVNEDRYQAISVDPINFEQKVVELPRCAINDNVIALFEQAEA